MYGQYRLPMISTPYFLVASQFDKYQLANELQLSYFSSAKPTTPAQLKYADDFATKTRALLTTINTDHPDNGVYSWACYNHCTSFSDSGYSSKTIGPFGTTMSSAFHQFLGFSSKSTGGGPYPYLQWMDHCTGFAC